eukprot:m.513611 g.513611  ORF g.513611 m.513611 type:complete len:432 (+) comp57445_c0_seq1:113-1408(+)
MSREPWSRWSFSQVFGDKTPIAEVADPDIISAVEFNHDGEYLATGDRGGRVVLFERNADPASSEYRFYTEFQSHEPEFDYLKSLEIEEKINQIKWLKRSCQAHMLLTTNDKTLKLWKVVEKQCPVDHAPPTLGSKPTIRGPKQYETKVDCRVKRVFGNAHTYHINSVSLNSDDETFLSADDLRINVWNLGVHEQSFNIVDLKPANMEELTEVITCAEFHPQHCSEFVYSNSRGGIKLGDMRAAALCDTHSKHFEETVDASAKGFFNEIVSSISHVKYSHDGRYFLARDYLNLKIWDSRMEKKPAQTFKVHEYLRPKLCDVYENDCIFDKFQATWSGDDRCIMTGSYNNHLRIFNRDTGGDVTFEASRENITAASHVLEPINVVSGPSKGGVGRDVSVDSLDFAAKILHASWHPKRGVLALAATNNLYLFRQ